MPILIPLATFLLQPIASSFLERVGADIYARLIAVDKPATPDAAPVQACFKQIEDGINRLETATQNIQDTIDCRQLADLKASLMNIRNAKNSKYRISIITKELHFLASIAENNKEGSTAGVPNTQLRCLAYTGLAVAHFLLQSENELIARYVAQAFDIDAITFQMFIKRDTMLEFSKILERSGFKQTGGYVEAIDRFNVLTSDSQVQQIEYLLINTGALSSKQMDPIRKVIKRQWLLSVCAYAVNKSKVRRGEIRASINSSQVEIDVKLDYTQKKRLAEIDILPLMVEVINDFNDLVKREGLQVYYSLTVTPECKHEHLQSLGLEQKSHIS